MFYVSSRRCIKPGNFLCIECGSTSKTAGKMGKRIFLKKILLVMAALVFVAGCGNGVQSSPRAVIETFLEELEGGDVARLEPLIDPDWLEQYSIDEEELEAILSQAINKFQKSTEHYTTVEWFIGDVQINNAKTKVEVTFKTSSKGVTNEKVSSVFLIKRKNKWYVDIHNGGFFWRHLL